MTNQFRAFFLELLIKLSKQAIWNLASINISYKLPTLYVGYSSLSRLGSPQISFDIWDLKFLNPNHPLDLTVYIQHEINAKWIQNKLIKIEMKMPLSPTALYHLQLNTNPPNVMLMVVRSFYRKRARSLPTGLSGWRMVGSSRFGRRMVESQRLVADPAVFRFFMVRAFSSLYL
jgi:hypothetical protein